MHVTRRRFGAVVASVFLPGALHAHAAQQTPLASASFDFATMPARKNETAEFRAILKGRTATGEEVEAHHTALAPGSFPYPGHHHAHNEIWLLYEGTAEITINGKTHRLGPGSAAYASSNDEHAIRNVGTTAAKYFIVTLGLGATTR